MRNGGTASSFDGVYDSPRSVIKTGLMTAKTAVGTVLGPAGAQSRPLHGKHYGLILRGLYALCSVDNTARLPFQSVATHRARGGKVTPSVSGLEYRCEVTA